MIASAGSQKSLYCVYKMASCYSVQKSPKMRDYILKFQTSAHINLFSFKNNSIVFFFKGKKKTYNHKPKIRVCMVGWNEVKRNWREYIYMVCTNGITKMKESTDFFKKNINWSITRLNFEDKSHYLTLAVQSVQHMDTISKEYRISVWLYNRVSVALDVWKSAFLEVLQMEPPFHYSSHTLVSVPLNAWRSDKNQTKMMSNHGILPDLKQLWDYTCT